MKVHIAHLDRVVQGAKYLNFPHHEADPNNTGVKEICQTNGKTFVDFDFPPRNASLYCPGPLAEQTGGKGERNCRWWSGSDLGFRMSISQYSF